MHVHAEQWAMIHFTGKADKIKKCKSIRAIEMYRFFIFFLQRELHIMEKDSLFSMTFIACSHGEIKFLRSKKTRIEKELKPSGIDSWNRIPSIFGISESNSPNNKLRNLPSMN